MKMPKIFKYLFLIPLVVMAVAALLSLKLTAADAGKEANIKKTFKVANGGQFVLDVDRGSVDIVTGDGSEVDVQVNRTVRKWSGAKADEIQARHEVSFKQEGNKVEVQARLKKESGFFNDDSGLQVEYIVTVPKQFNLDLKTAGGTIKVGNLVGDLKASTAGGNLQLAKVDGHVNGSTSGGSINLEAATKETALKSAGGNLRLGELSAPTLAETAGGSIDVRIARAKLTAKTAGGSITIHEAHDTLNAKTSGGSITASLVAQPKEDCELNTAAGSVHLKIVPTLAFDIDAKTSAGRVSSELPLTGGESKNSHLQGRLNNGGTSLKLHTSAGSISIEKCEPPARTGWLWKSGDRFVMN